jgi:hypothetical protein
MSERFMKKIKPEMDDWLRPEYKRTDFGELVRGKYAGTHLEFADLVRLLIACIGKHEKIQFAWQAARRVNSSSRTQRASALPQLITKLFRN